MQMDIKGNESGVGSSVYWRDKNGKSFLYDEKGRPRMIQFKAEKASQGKTEPMVLFSVATLYPRRDIEYERPFGTHATEAGPMVIIQVPQRYLVNDKDNTVRFDLLEQLEQGYKKDIQNDQEGIARLIKQFADTPIVNMVERSQTAVYLQDQLQERVDSIVREKLADKKMPEPKQVSKSMPKQERNAFKELSYKEKQFVIMAQDDLRNRDIRDKKGNLICFDRKAENAQEEYKRFRAEAFKYGVKLEHRPRTMQRVKPNAVKEVNLFSGVEM